MYKASTEFKLIVHRNKALENCWYYGIIPTTQFFFVLLFGINENYPNVE